MITKVRRPSSVTRPRPLLTHALLLSEIKEDVEEECSKYGTIVELKIPRPVGASRTSPGVGKIYVKYDTPESAQKALRALAGRKFADRTVVTTFFPEVSAWNHPPGL